MKACTLLSYRSRSNRWVYLLLAIIYFILAEYAIADLDINIRKIWMIFAPLLIFLVQLIYPTVLGWLVIFLAFSFYSAVGIFYFIRNNLEFTRTWSENIFGGLLILVFCFLSIVLFIIRPKNK